MTSVESSGKKHRVIAPDGVSVMVIAKMNKLPIRGTCGGKLACASCHVIVESGWFFRLLPASESEETLLDVVPGAMQTSRLCCQIRMRPEFSGLVVRLPPNTAVNDTISMSGHSASPTTAPKARS